MKILLTHLWPESNAGDLAISLGTINTLRKNIKQEIDFIGLTTFGKHTDNLSFHFNETIKHRVDLYPAINPSYKDDNCTQYSNYEKILMSLRLLGQLFFLHLGYLKLAKLFLNNTEKESLKKIMECQYAIIKGGAFLMGFQGIKGFIYLIRNSLTILWCRKLGIKCMIAPHSFGPFSNKLQIKLLAKNIGSNTLIFAREKESLLILEKQNLNVHYLPDMAFAFEYSHPAVTRKNTIAITVRPCPTFLSENSQKKYYTELAFVVAELINKNFEIVMFTQVSGPDHREDDNIAIDNIIHKVHNIIDPHQYTRVYKKQLLSIDEKINFLSNCKGVIGTRMHSVIFSLLSGTPVVAIAYLGPKHSGIMSEFNLSEYTFNIKNINGKEILDSIENAIKNQNIEANKLKSDQFRHAINKQFSDFFN